jgi:hypothetical protein
LIDRRYTSAAIPPTNPHSTNRTMGSTIHRTFLLPDRSQAQSGCFDASTAAMITRINEPRPTTIQIASTPPRTHER